MAGKAVATKKQAQVAAFDPSIFEEDAGAGNENITQDDLALPFLKILSGLDPLLDELEVARKGDIYNTVTGDLFKGSDGIRVIPCAYQRRFIEWAPRGTGSGAPVNIFTPDEKRPETERSKDDNREYVVGGDGTYIEDTHQHFVLVLDEDGTAQPALIAMKSTQLKKSRKWNSMVQGRMATGANGRPFQMPRFSHVYTLKSIKEENSKGAWHGWDIALEGQVSDITLYGQAKEFANSVNAGDVNVKHSQDDGNAPQQGNDIPF
jgi:hypothetical protein